MSLTEIISFGNEDEPGPAGVRNLIFRKLFLTMVIILVATLSFGIGRLTAPEVGGEVEIEHDQSLSGGDLKASVIESIKPATSEEVIASNKGKKYHYSHCPGAKQISSANRITFTSALNAEASGYTLASNCKPR